MSAGDIIPTAGPWYPLLAMAESDSELAEPGQATRLPLSQTPSPALKQALRALREALREELETSSRRLWLLLDTAPGGEADPGEIVSTGHEVVRGREADPGELQVSRVLEELRQKFQELRPLEGGSAPPDFEAFLREKMLSLGFDDLGSAPLLPELQREALRGLGVGIGSQMAQLLGRLAGWHSEGKAVRPKVEDETGARGLAGVKLLRLELGADLAADKAWTALLRQEVAKVRRRASHRLGWEISGFALAVNKDLEDGGWRVLLRGDPIAVGQGKDELTEALEPIVTERAEALFPFAEFEAMLRQPGCKLVVKELRALGLEKAALWTVCRKVLAGGGNLREPLTVLERILEASITSQQLPYLVQAVLAPSAEV